MGFRVKGFWFRVQGSGFRVPGLGFVVEGVEFRVLGLPKVGGGVRGAEEGLEAQDGTVVAIEGRETTRGGAIRRTEIRSNKNKRV